MKVEKQNTLMIRWAMQKLDNATFIFFLFHRKFQVEIKLNSQIIYRFFLIPCDSRDCNMSRGYLVSCLLTGSIISTVVKEQIGSFVETT